MRTSSITLAALALLGACATPPPRPRTVTVAPPPRSWTERDLSAPRGPAVLPEESTAHRPSQGGYPADPAEKVFTSSIARPPEAYRPATENGRTLRITEIAARRILAALPALGTVPLRTSVWPGTARVVEHDSLGVLIATDAISLASLRSEVVCTGVAWDREAAVRLQAYIATEHGAVTVTPRISVAGPAGAPEPVCQVGTVGQDRIAAFAIDVAAALRQGARTGMAVPIRRLP